MADDVLVIRIGDPSPQVVGAGFDSSPTPIFVPGSGGGGGGARFSLNFVNANPVVVNHNLGIYPHVTIIVGGEEIDADVVYSSLNQLTLTFSGPQTGHVEVS